MEKLARSSAHDSFDLEVLAKQALQEKKVLSLEDVQKRGMERAARAHKAAEKCLREAALQRASGETVAVRDEQTWFERMRDEDAARRKEVEREFREAERSVEARVRSAMAAEAADAAVVADVDRELQEARAVVEEHERKAARAEAALDAALRSARPRPPGVATVKTRPPPVVVKECPKGSGQRKLDRATLREELERRKKTQRLESAAKARRLSRDRRREKDREFERQRDRRVEIGRERLRRDRVETGVRAALQARKRLALARVADLARAINNAEKAASHAALAANRALEQVDATQKRAVKAARKLDAELRARDGEAAQRAALDALDAEAADAANQALVAIEESKLFVVTLVFSPTRDATQSTSLAFRLPKAKWATRPARKLVDTFAHGYAKCKPEALPVDKDRLRLRT